MKTDTFPITKDIATAGIFAEILQHQRRTAAFAEDPISQCCGCIDDFHEAFDCRLRKLVYRLLKRAEQTKEEQVKRWALAAMERWMP